MCSGKYTQIPLARVWPCGDFAQTSLLGVGLFTSLMGRSLAEAVFFAQRDALSFPFEHGKIKEKISLIHYHDKYRITKI